MRVLHGEKVFEDETATLKAGDLVFNPALDRHATVALKDAEYIAPTRGPHGGVAYEQDTYRLDEPLVSEQEPEQAQSLRLEGGDLEP